MIILMMIKGSFLCWYQAEASGKPVTGHDGHHSKPYGDDNDDDDGDSARDGDFIDDDCL